MQERGQQGDAGDERNDHAGPCDQSQFREALIGRRQEREKSGGRRGRGKRQGPTSLHGGAAQGEVDVVEIVSLGPITDAELKCEIDADADEQYGEGDRDQIQGVDHHQAKRRRDGKARGKTEKNRQYDFRRSQGEPQDDEDRKYRQNAIQQCAFLQGREFLIGDGHTAGQPHAGAELLGKLQIGCCLSDRGRGCGARLQGVEVQNWLHLDEPAQIACRRRLAAHEHAPGKACGAPCQIIIQRIGEHRVIGRARSSSFICPA